MKIFVISVIAVGTVFLALQAYMANAANKTEVQPFTVVHNEKDFEIRLYPAATMATITSSAKTYKDLGNSGFRKLANYIFGGNEENKQIAMTSPVYMDINDSASTMSFVMPANYNVESLPNPNSAEVKISTTTEVYVAAITFKGFASDNAIKVQTEKLEAALNASGISYYGHFRFLGYNPPFQLFNRKNEIIVNVNWTSK